MCLDTEEVSVKDCIILTVVGLLCVFLRNNGIYAVIPAMIVMAFLMRKKIIRRLLWSCSAFVIVVSVIINGPVFNSMGIEKVNIREALSIPMQQSARYVKEYGDEVTDEEMAALGTFFNDYYALPEIYEPFCADAVKNTVFVQKENLGKYFLTWFKMGLKHPGVYFAATLNTSYKFFDITWKDLPIFTRFVSRVDETDELYIKSYFTGGELNKIIRKLFLLIEYIPIVGLIFVPSFYTWLTIFCFLAVLKKNSIKQIGSVSLPFCSVLIFFACPGNLPRYSMPIILMAAIMLVSTLYRKTK
jgi:hypothetical protein